MFNLIGSIISDTSDLFSWNGFLTGRLFILYGLFAFYDRFIADESMSFLRPDDSEELKRKDQVFLDEMRKAIVAMAEHIGLDGFC